MLRFAFTDGSFFDYRVLGSDTAFIDGLLQRWPA